MDFFSLIEGNTDLLQCRHDFRNEIVSEQTTLIYSSEVLQHSNSYGIHSIDDNSLKSFIKDLKKLIKYEHYKNVYGTNFETNDPPEQNISNSLTQDDSLSAVHDNQRKKSCCGRKHIKENIRPIYSEELAHNNKVHYEEVKSKCPCRTLHSQPAVQSSAFKNDIRIQKPLCKCKHRIPPNDDDKSTINKLQEDANNMKRPPSLLSCTRSQATTIRNKKGRCDPVELYHYYNSFWKNHKFPGENDHAQLRVAIRKRLMNAK